MNDYFEQIGLFHGNRVGLAYGLGFAGSIMLTVAAYVLATQHVMVSRTAVIALAGLAILQFLLQARTFLHLDASNSSRERLAMLGLATVVVLILVSGSIWILWHLDARMMPTIAQMQAYVQDQPGI